MPSVSVFRIPPSFQTLKIDAMKNETEDEKSSITEWFLVIIALLDEYLSGSYSLSVVLSFLSLFSNRRVLWMGRLCNQCAFAPSLPSEIAVKADSRAKF